MKRVLASAMVLAVLGIGSVALGQGEPSSGCPSIAPSTLAGTAYPPGVGQLVVGSTAMSATVPVPTASGAPARAAATPPAVTMTPAAGTPPPPAPPSAVVVTPGPVVVTTPAPPAVVVTPPAAPAGLYVDNHTMSPIAGNASAGLAAGGGAAWESFDTGTPSPRSLVSRNLC